jgi:4Fe-4S ferredoxin
MVVEKSCRNNGNMPQVDQSRCEAKEQCVAACPYNVFELRLRTREEISILTLMGKIRARAHKNMVGSPLHIDLCKSCGDCVVSCPEHAIKLIKRQIKSNFFILSYGNTSKICTVLQGLYYLYRPFHGFHFLLYCKSQGFE